MRSGASLSPEYLAVVAALPVKALLYDGTGVLLHANPLGLAHLQELGLLDEGGELADVDLAACVAPDDQRALREAMLAAQQGRATPSLRLEFVGPPGQRAIKAVVFTPLVLSGRSYVQVLALDITTRVTAERGLVRSEARFRAVFDHSPIGVAVVDQRRFTVINPAMCALLGRTADELIGTSPDAVTHPDDVGLSAEIRAALGRGEIARVNKRYLRPDGSVVWGELVAVRLSVEGTTQTLVHLRDLTSEREATANLEHMLMHDPLTGLGNRLLLQDRLEHALARRHEVRRSLAVLFLDLDGFKRINDALGHVVGDRVLKVMGRRVRDAVRPADTAARWGGDEFVILLEDLAGDDEALDVVHRLEQAMAAPIEHRNDELLLTVSVGVAYAAPEETITAHELLAGADAAMYRAKQNGRNGHSIFDQALRDAAVRRSHIEAVLRAAADGERVVLHYQPLVELETGRTVGAEALLRLIDDDGTLLHPDSFLDVAEETELMLGVEHVVLKRACEQAAEWNDAGYDMSISINVCAQQIARMDSFEAAVSKALTGSGLEPRRLVCEVTEHALMDTGDRAVAGIHRLRARGVQFAVDDFGTGYSSMTYLQALPLSEVKIDRRFVVRAGEDPRAAAIVRAVAGMAEELDMRCVAEGIEDEPTQALARRLGATIGQGFHYARPIAAERFLEYLQR